MSVDSEPSDRENEPDTCGGAFQQFTGINAAKLISGLLHATTMQQTCRRNGHVRIDALHQRPADHGRDQVHYVLTREEKRRRRRATQKYRMAHATRERIRVEAFNVAFSQLRQLLPTLPPDKKLSKIEILRLAICYISYLNHVLDV